MLIEKVINISPQQALPANISSLGMTSGVAF
jgi:hypothetical protein